MNSFLDYLREMLIANQEFMVSLKGQYKTDDFVKTLLAFDELNDQLSTIERLTVGSLFSTKIADIIGAANVQPSHFQDEDEKEADYTLSQLKGLRGTIENGIIPIDSDGEILLYIDEDDGKYMMSTLSTGNIVYVDKNGNRLDKSNNPLIIEVKNTVTKQELIKALKDFDIFFMYFKATINGNKGTPTISEDAELLGINLTEQFITEHKIKQEELYSNQIHLTKFRKWLVIEYKRIEAAMEKTPIADTTRIDEWRHKNIVAKPQKQLPNVAPTQRYPAIKGKAKLTVVQN